MRPAAAEPALCHADDGPGTAVHDPGYLGDPRVRRHGSDQLTCYLVGADSRTIQQQRDQITDLALLVQFVRNSDLIELHSGG